MKLSLEQQWRQAASGDAAARARWTVAEDGDWQWCAEGVRLNGGGAEWEALVWRDWEKLMRAGAQNFIVEAYLSGKAEAAGLSCGPYQDFLVALRPDGRPRHLQLEVDRAANLWAYRVDGQLQERCWWDAAVEDAESLCAGALRLKARHPGTVLFQDLALHTLSSSCQLSVIVTCHRFLQRLRVTLRNWCHQEASTGAFEVLVVNPQSPDGTHEHLAAVARSYPHVRLREIPVNANLAMNKGKMINHALQASRGEWVWLTDADCLFAPQSLALVLRQIAAQPRHLYFGQRRFLSAAQTDALLAGRVDGLRDFAQLAESPTSRAPENHPWGYTQIFHRSLLEQLRYREDFQHYAHSDGAFIEECQRLGVTPRQVEGLFCLHLDHPFAWYGTNVFL